MPRLEGFQECRSIIGGVMEMPQTDNRRWTVGFPSVLMRQPRQYRTRTRLKRLTASCFGTGRTDQQHHHGRRGKHREPALANNFRHIAEKLTHVLSPLELAEAAKVSLPSFRGASAGNLDYAPGEHNAPEFTLALIFVHQTTS
jgi:hypothetical protein